MKIEVEHKFEVGDVVMLEFAGMWMGPATINAIHLTRCWWWMDISGEEKQIETRLYYSVPIDNVCHSPREDQMRYPTDEELRAEDVA